MIFFFKSFNWNIFEGGSMVFNAVSAFILEDSQEHSILLMTAER